MPIQTRRMHLMNFTQHLLNHPLDHACGGRVEVRVKAPNDAPHTLKDLWPHGQMLLKSVQTMMNRGMLQKGGYFQGEKPLECRSDMMHDRIGANIKSSSATGWP